MSTAPEIQGVGTDRVDDAIAIDRDQGGNDKRANYLEERASRGELLIAYGGGRPVGFVCFEGAGFFGRPFVSLLVVAPPHRRHGVGAELLAAAEGKTRERRIFISTNQSNGPMIGLLRKCGYTPCGWVSGLDEGDPELFYFKDLPR